jgi:hypothetical protein
MGASLLVFKNKSDVPGCMNEEDIREVRVRGPARRMWLLTFTGIAIGRHPHPQMAHFALLSHDRLEPARRASMGRSRRKRPSFPLLIHKRIGKSGSSLSSLQSLGRHKPAFLASTLAPLPCKQRPFHARHTCMENPCANTSGAATNRFIQG